MDLLYSRIVFEKVRHNPWVLINYISISIGVSFNKNPRSVITYVDKPESMIEQAPSSQSFLGSGSRLGSSFKMNYF